MKCFMKDDQFHPIRDTKGVRKSRDQNTKVVGIPLIKNRMSRDIKLDPSNPNFGLTDEQLKVIDENKKLPQKLRIDIFNEKDYSPNAELIEIGKVQQKIIEFSKNELGLFQGEFAFKPFVGNGKLFDGQGNELQISKDVIYLTSID